VGVRVPPSAPAGSTLQDHSCRQCGELLVESVRTTDDQTYCEAYGVDQGQNDEMQLATSSNDWQHVERSHANEPAEVPHPQKTVLIVEDDEAVSSLLVALLEERGYIAVPAMDGRSAIELARTLEPHLITLDLALPGTDGHQVLESLKANPQTRDIPVVVISAFTQILPAGDRKKLAYLLGKPFDVSEVLEIVQATVGNPFV
jgi:CheY-like chemotaxis protein